MKIATERITKEYVIDNNRIESVKYVNLLTGKELVEANPQEFTLTYLTKSTIFFKAYEIISNTDCELVSAAEFDGGNELIFRYNGDNKDWRFVLTNKTDGNVIKTYLDFQAEDDNILIDSVELMSYDIAPDKFSWSRPITDSTSTIPLYLTQLGQPVYYDSFFTGIEFTAADNMIDNGRLSLKYYIGRKLSELNADEYEPHNAVIGAALGDTMTAHRASFFEYVETFARPKRFRIQFNSWYDNMLDITHENLEEMFRGAREGFKSHGLRDIDCYVVDDGWVDYKKPEFWAFNEKFSDGFDKEKKLTEEFNSTFGIWFGPRGGYTEARSYAKQLKSIGYNINFRGGEICSGSPKYIADLTDKMCDFMREYNATYFKIDGFSFRPCRNKKHGHPTGGFQEIYYYGFMWEKWAKAFEKLRAINPDVFLNITSYSNCSPWALKYADAVWINNSSDMGYEGEGGNLDQCLNYRDGRYHDFCQVRQLQFPNAYIYNHEPCYASRNYNPPLPNKSHKTVVYSDDEFREYLFMCMMRGTGFIELYYSPSMFNDEKWKINTEVLTWAEKNFDILSESLYFGGVPKQGEVYGYLAYRDGRGYIAIRNPKNETQSYSLKAKDLTHNGGKFTLRNFYDNAKGVNYKNKNGVIEFELEPFAMAILEIKY